MGITAMIAGSLGSALIGSNSAAHAADAQASAADQQAQATRYASDQANATQRYIFNQSNALTATSRNIGNNALRDMGSTMGVATAAPGFKGFQADPGYQFQLQQGQQAIDRAAAARGENLGGATLKASSDYNQGMASSAYGNWYNRLAGLAGIGQAGTSQALNAGQNYGNNVSQNYLSTGAALGTSAINAGNARASGYMNQNDAMQGGINNLYNVYGMQQAGFFGNGGSGGGMNPFSKVMTGGPGGGI